MVGFIFKKIKKTGLFKKHIYITYACPNCRKTVKELPIENFIETTYGYKFSDIEQSHCPCGYHANFIIKDKSKLDENRTFKRTCRECGAAWNFTFYDAKLSSAKKMAAIGSAFSDNIKEADLNRCDKCGSRKVTIEFSEDDTPKTYDSPYDEIANSNLSFTEKIKQCYDLAKKQNGKSK